MQDELSVLVVAAASIGFIHTILGPDHYLPFIAMSKSGRWSLQKTALITLLCGCGHVLSSVLLGLIGVTFGIAVIRLQAVEQFRGNIAGWALLAFGLVYFLWGVKQALRNKPHRHLHAHGFGLSHEHEHSHTKQHLHAHTEANNRQMTPWILFTIFIFGPCEPLIPLLMYPAARGSIWSLVSVTVVFALVTISTMLGIVLMSAIGVSFLPLSNLERYTHALAGATLCLCGISIQFFAL